MTEVNKDNALREQMLSLIRWNMMGGCIRSSFDNFRNVSESGAPGFPFSIDRCERWWLSSKLFSYAQDFNGGWFITLEQIPGRNYPEPASDILLATAVLQISKFILFRRVLHLSPTLFLGLEGIQIRNSQLCWPGLLFSCKRSQEIVKTSRLSDPTTYQFEIEELSPQCCWLWDWKHFDNLTINTVAEIFRQSRKGLTM